MTLIPQTNNVQSHSDFALGSLVNDFIPPKDFLEFDSRYGAYRTIGRMTAGIHILHHRDDLLQETIAAVAQKGIIERLTRRRLERQKMIGRTCCAGA